MTTLSGASSTVRWHPQCQVCECVQQVMTAYQLGPIQFQGCKDHSWLKATGIRGERMSCITFSTAQGWRKTMPTPHRRDWITVTAPAARHWPSRGLSLMPQAHGSRRPRPVFHRREDPSNARFLGRWSCRSTVAWQPRRRTRKFVGPSARARDGCAAGSAAPRRHCQIVASGRPATSTGEQEGTKNARMCLWGAWRHGAAFLREDELQSELRAAKSSHATERPRAQRRASASVFCVSCFPLT